MITFQFIDIKDISKIYTESEVNGNPFGNSGISIRRDYVAVSYYNSLFECLKANNKIISYSHKGCINRIASEVYEVKTTDATYDITFTFDSYEKYNQLTVMINYTNEEQNSNRNLEKLKFAIKEFLIKDWDKCIWLRDDQSEALASKLYNKMYFVENSIRELVNCILIKVLGKGWIDLSEFSNVREEYNLRNVDFKRTVDNFKNVDDFLISINTETLFKIMKTVIYEQSIELGETLQENIGIKAKIFQGKDGSVSQILRKLYKKKYDLWEDFFKKLFPVNVDEKIITDFIKNRNHIAHNKLVDFHASEKIESNITQMEGIIKSALNKISEIEMSEEYIETLDTIAEQKQEEKEVALSIKEAEAGITIRSGEQIFQYLSGVANDFYETIRDKFYFREDISFTDYCKPEGPNIRSELFRISSNINELDTLSVYGLIDVTDGEGETSTLFISIERENKTVIEAEIGYLNGEAVYDEDQCCYLPENDSEIDSEKLNELEEELIDFIERDMNSIKKKIDDSRYSVIKDGGELQVANVSCWNCGEEYISIDNEIYPYGKCINCGAENELNECGNCGIIYNKSDDGDDFFCGYCKSKIEDE